MINLMFNDGFLWGVVSNVKDDEGWFYFTLVTNGPNANNGVSVYLNGDVNSDEITAYESDAQNGDGYLRINEESKSVGAYVDELTFLEQGVIS